MTIIRNMPLADYFNGPGVSSTKLKDFARSPKLFYDKWIGKTLPSYDDDDESKALTFGKGFEALLVDDIGIFPGIRARQFSDFVVKPAAPDKRADGRTVEGKEWTKANAGKSIISASEHAAMQVMVQAIAEHEDARAMLRDCEQQVTFQREVFDGILLQSRPDFVNLRGNALSGFLPYTIDLKTCEDLDRVDSGRQIVDFGYARQADIASICMLDHVETRVLHLDLFVEKRLPHRVDLVDLGDWTPDARVWVMGNLERMQACLSSGSWPRATRTGITRLARPAWVKDEGYAA